VVGRDDGRVEGWMESSPSTGMGSVVTMMAVMLTGLGALEGRLVGRLEGRREVRMAVPMLSVTVAGGWVGKLVGRGWVGLTVGRKVGLWAAGGTELIGRVLTGVTVLPGTVVTVPGMTGLTGVAGVVGVVAVEPGAGVTPTPTLPVFLPVPGLARRPPVPLGAFAGFAGGTGGAGGATAAGGGGGGGGVSLAFGASPLSTTGVSTASLFGDFPSERPPSIAVQSPHLSFPRRCPRTDAGNTTARMKRTNSKRIYE
jgi:hypothetical protein